jgi:hypothetical protein
MNEKHLDLRQQLPQPSYKTLTSVTYIEESFFASLRMTRLENWREIWETPR